MNIKQLAGLLLRGGALDQAGKTAARALLTEQWEQNAERIADRVRHEGDRSIREILLHTWAHGTQPELGGTVGDILRDEYEEKVTALAAPQIEADTPEAERIRIVQTALLDVLF